MLLEVLSDEAYPTLTAEEKEGCKEVDEETMKIHKYTVKGKFEPVYYIKER